MHKKLNNEIYQYACSNENSDDSTFEIIDNGAWDENKMGISYSSLKVKDEYLKHDNVSMNTFKNVEVINVKTRKLNSILEEAEVESVDFLSVDTEGWELEVVQGFNIEKYNPKVVLLENYIYTPTYEQYMDSIGYKLDTRLNYNYIFVKK